MNLLEWFRTAQTPKTPPRTLDEPILAFRAWRIDNERELLLSCTCDHVWQPRTRESAHCTVNRTIHCGVPPAWNCSCGFYAYKTVRDLTASRYSDSPSGLVVIGRVALWGRVIDHARGYRGMHAYPQILFYRSSNSDDLVRRVADRYAIECVPSPEGV